MPRLRLPAAAVGLLATAGIASCLPALPAREDEDDDGDQDDDGGPDDDGGGDDDTVFAPGAFAAHFFDIGTGDATLIVSPTGETLLVDLGVPQVESGSTWESAERVVARIEEVVGRARVDAFVATHYHTDHVGSFWHGGAVGGLPYAVESLGLEVGVLLDRGPDPEGDSGTQDEYLEWRAVREHRVIDAPGTDWIDLGPEVTAEVLAAPGDEDLVEDPNGTEENNLSLALRVTYGDLEISLCGDLPGSYTERDGAVQYQDVETALADRMGAVEVLKPNHHGSQSSTNVAWLRATRPLVAVYALGPNDYGYPHEYTWDRLHEATSARGGRVYLTRDRYDQEVDGEVVVRSEDGRAFSVGEDVYQALSDAEEDALPNPLPHLSPEASDAACSDGVDNDGDCYCDCYDWSCALDPSVSACDGPGGSWCHDDEGPYCDGVWAGTDR